jgi:hypothetical protein
MAAMTWSTWIIIMICIIILFAFLYWQAVKIQKAEQEYLKNGEPGWLKLRK